MKSACFLIAALLAAPAFAQAPDLDLTGFQRPEGAITSGYNGDNVDPYFATLSLLLARDGGLNAQKPSLDWIDWAIHMQASDGSFERYRLDPASGIWKGYANTDADDAMSALWLELLYRTAPASGMPKNWKASAAKTENVLSSLYSKNLGIYYISSSNQVGLLMDNIEIYSAFKRISLDAKRIGDTKTAAAYAAKAESLAAAIQLVFKPEGSDTFFVTTQLRDAQDFYPDKVAQIFPVLYQLPAEQNPASAYKRWTEANTREWMDQRNNDYPWGLVALAALSVHDDDMASCWENRAEPMRYSGHWNVLEEASLQQVKYRVAADHDDKIPCVGIEL